MVMFVSDGLIYDFDESDTSFFEVKEVDPSKTFSEALVRCCQCKKSKLTSEMHRHSKNALGYDICSTCHAVNRGKHYEKNSEAIRAKRAADYAVNYEMEIRQASIRWKARCEAIRNGTYVRKRIKPEGSGWLKVPRYYEFDGDLFVLFTGVKFNIDEE